MIEIGGTATSLQRSLDVGCTLVHVLITRFLNDPRLDADVLELLEELALPAAVYDAAGRKPQLVNGAWHVVFGSHALPSSVDARFDEVVRTGASVHVAEVALEQGGRPAYCAATLRPIRDPAGAITGVIVVCAQTTDDVIARRLAVDPDTPVASGPSTGGFDYGNRAWRMYAGDASTCSWETVTHASDLHGCVLALSEASRRRVATEVEARLHRSDGEYRWHRIRFTVTDPGPRWFATATDIDDAQAEAERTALLARERAARAEAEQASRLKDQFVAAVSHELRTPITTMLLWEKVLCDDRVDAAARAQAISAIHESAATQSRLVDDLLDVSRAISGKLHVDLRVVDLEHVLGEALAAIAPHALAKEITLERRGAPITTEVQGDDARLRQVFDNLLSNAVKFTDRGGRIGVTVVREGRSIIIDVVDSGRGIAPELLQRVFEPFSQSEDSLTETAGGLGLGLTIARQIVALHHGALVATSAGRGQGTTFTVTLPIASGRRPALASPGRPLRSLARVRILVIDDDQRVRDALALLLDRAGAVVDTAESAEAGRARIASSLPEAVLCDIAMPDEDGYSFVQRLRASGARIPVIALTARATESDARRALAAGFDLHLAKPIDFERLVENIDELIAARRITA
jgi:signal transduction histidine kinase